MVAELRLWWPRDAQTQRMPEHALELSTQRPRGADKAERVNTVIAKLGLLPVQDRDIVNLRNCNAEASSSILVQVDLICKRSNIILYRVCLHAHVDMRRVQTHYEITSSF